MVSPGSESKPPDEEAQLAWAGVARPVAIIDDDDAVRDSLAFALRAVDIATVGFSSAAEFLQADIARFSCVVVDQRMPHMTGLQLAARIRRTNRQFPILLMSGDLSNDERRRASLLGIERVVDKPVQFSGIVEFVGMSARYAV